MPDKQSAIIYDYQARAREFKVNDFVHPIGNGPMDIGRVSQVFPGIGMIQVEFSYGSQRIPVEDVERIRPSEAHVDPTRVENVPGGSRDLPSVSAGRAPVVTPDNGLETPSGKDKTMTGDATVGPTGAPAASITITASDMADRVARAYVKRALYWHSADRNYRATKEEVDGGGYTCPKCKEGTLRKAIYKMRKGERHRLYVCPNCSFVIKQDNIHGEHHLPKEEFPPHAQVLSMVRERKILASEPEVK